MKITIQVEYDTETGRYSIDSKNSGLEFSGSSYYRIRTKDCYGTIGCYNFYEKPMHHLRPEPIGEPSQFLVIEMSNRD